MMDDDNFHHRPVPPTPTRKPTIQPTDNSTKQNISSTSVISASNSFAEEHINGSSNNSPVTKSPNNPSSVNYVSTNKRESAVSSPSTQKVIIPPKLPQKKPQGTQFTAVQQTGYCRGCGVPILYTSLGEGETLVKCYDCPEINSFVGVSEAIDLEDENYEDGNFVISKEGGSNLNNRFKGAFRSVKNNVSKTSEAVKSSNFMKVAAERTAVAAQQAKVVAQKAGQSTKVAAQKASQTTKEATKAMAQKAKNLQKGNSQSEEDPPVNNLSNNEEYQVPNETKIFGIPLEEAIQKSSTLIEGIPDVITKCASFIRERGLKEEGIFRLSGSQQAVKDLKFSFDKGLNPDLNEVMDEHVVTGLLKLYFRDLPEPLFTNELANEFRNLNSKGMPEEFMPPLVTAVNKLPKINFVILKFLVELLAEVCKYEAQNKMSTQNLGIVFAPTLGCPMEVIGCLIKNYKEVFNFDLIDL